MKLRRPLKIDTSARLATLATVPLLALIAGLSARAATPDPFLVVIDPGHGGQDHGAVYERSGVRVSEKEVTLKLALAAARELRAQGVRVVLTRGEDRDMTLPDRTALANRLGADVFVSLHMNSSTRSGAEGVETYILNHSTDQASERLARLENKVLPGSRAGELPESDIGLIIKDLLLDSTAADSRKLACAVQRELVTSTSSAVSRRARDRGVRQGLFYVLLGADMPSVLVETGFLNHAIDRALVLSEQGQRNIAQALARSMVRFRDGGKRARTAHASLSTCPVH
jgi:N-acetylmuramoyl-L-alanine amidase